MNSFFNQMKNKKNVRLLAAFITIIIIIGGMKPKPKELKYSEFINLVENGEVESVEIVDGEIRGLTKDKKVFKTVSVKNDSLVETLMDNNVEFKGTVSYSGAVVAIIQNLLLLGAFIFILNKSTERMGGNKKHTEFTPDDDQKIITFDDVAGQDEAKEQLLEVLDFMENPKKYEKIGATLPAGVLLEGPPGTGKTLMAKALAGEINKRSGGEKSMAFYSISGSDFVEMFVGVGARRVKSLFEEAKKNSPSIIFIDELDAIGKKRDGRMSSNDEREQTLLQLLTEMDGFNSDEASIFVIGATNNPGVLDNALLRAGRFDRRIIVNLPDKQGRIDTIKTYVDKYDIKDIDIERIATITPGASGADLAKICNEAAIRAVRFGRTSVIQEDFEEAVDEVIAGTEKKNAILTPEEKEVVAIHEIGHAVIAVLENTAPLEKITIIPRTTGALGFTLQIPEHDKVLYSKKELISEIKVLFGGRAAEEVFYGETSVTTGASNDIERASALMRDMITRYGMSEKFGMMGMEMSGGDYLGYDSSSTVSDQTKHQVDIEIKKWLDELYKETVIDITNNRDKVKTTSDYLYEKETISGDEFRELFFEQ